MQKDKREAQLSSFCPDHWLYRLLRRIIFRLFPPVFRVLYGWRICGEIPEEAVRQGGVSVCNHIHTLDCIMMAYLWKDYFVQFLTLASNLRIPVAGPIVKLMGGIPLPESIDGWKPVYQRVEKAFSEGQILQIYPEGELIGGCRQLRPFRPGAFTFAVKYKKPVIPCVLRFYPRFRKNGVRRKDGMELVILPPVYPPSERSGKAAAKALLEEVRERMEEALNG